MSRARSQFVTLGAVVLFAWPALGADFFMEPISASGSHTVAGSMITLDGGGQTVTLELRIDAWDPIPDVGVCGDLSLCSIAAQDCLIGACQGSNGLLNTYQARIDGSGYAGVLSPVLLPGNELINTSHPDYVFSGLTSIPAVDTSTINWAYGALLLFANQSPPYPGVDKYGGTLVIDVPLGASGDFTIGLFDDLNQTFMEDSNATAIVPINGFAAIIRVVCQTPADCDDGNVCTTDACEVGGTCSHTPNHPATHCCDPITGVLTVIDDGDECTDDVCNADGTVSHPPSPAGTACGDPSSTQCDFADSCDGAGVCLPNPAPAGTACGSPADTDCSNPDSCDGSGTCSVNNEPVGTPCGDQTTTDCSLPDTCNAAAACVANNLPMGTACGDPSNTDCTDPDTCNRSGICLANDAPNGTACDDGLFCNIGEACTSGACGGGSPRDCNDGLACTDDWCDEVGDVCVNDVLPGFCLIGGVCRGDGEANPANACEVCDPAASNTTWSAIPDGSACDDGLFCSVGETCTAGTCGGGAARDCEEGIACTGDTCNEATNQCDHAPNDALCPDDGVICNGAEFCNAATGCDHAGAPDGTACDDGLFCNIDETCTAGTCGGGTPNPCADGLACTSDVCNEATTACENDLLPDSCLIGGTCRGEGELNPANDCEACDSAASTSAWSNLPDGSACDDGLFCNVDETCTAGACGGGAARDCEDGIACTDDSCNEASDHCNNFPNDALCPDDGVICNGDEFCNAATGCDHTGVPDGTSCDDGLFCNVGETCTADACGGGGPRDCSDPFSCTDDTCNEALSQCENDISPGFCLINGICRGEGELNPANDCEACDTATSTTTWSNLADGSACDDGLFCNVNETCAAGTCGGGVARDCEEGIACTGDACNEATNQCDHTPNDALCPDDGVICNGAEFCNAATGCDHAGVPDGTVCNDGLFCNINETCTAGTCGGGEPNPCADGLSCTSDVCNEATTACENDLLPNNCLISGTCRGEGELNPANDCEACASAASTSAWSNLPNGTTCDDTLFCTVDEFCTAGACGGGGARNCEEGIACTGDTCNEGTNQCDHTPNDALCPDDGVICNGAEFCNAATGCDHAGVPDGTACDDGIFCNVGETCTAGACGSGGPRDCSDAFSCTADTCNEAATQCENDIDPGFCLIANVCETEGTINPGDDCEACDPAASTSAWSDRPDGSACDDGLFCNVDEACTAGACGGGAARDCEEGVFCTDDTCNEATDECEHAALDALCPDDGQFCNGDEFCHITADCDHTGSPCSGPCDEVGDTCLCDPPVVEDVGSRYMKIAGMPADSLAPMAIIVTADCPGGVPMYVTAPVEFNLGLTGPFANLGLLSTDPADAVYLTPAEWGDLYVTGGLFTPDTNYVVLSDCGSPGDPAYSEPGIGTPFTRVWCDVDNSGVVTFIDINRIVRGFQGLFDLGTKESVDLKGGTADVCTPNQSINFLDITAAVEAFQGLPYEASCPNPCD